MVGEQANALEVQVRQDLHADADLQMPRCRPLHLNGGLFSRDGHAINAQRGGRDRAAEIFVVITQNHGFALITSRCPIRH
jgi:hypothetical protein